MEEARDAIHVEPLPQTIGSSCERRHPLTVFLARRRLGRHKDCCAIYLVGQYYILDRHSFQRMTAWKISNRFIHGYARHISQHADEQIGSSSSSLAHCGECSFHFFFATACLFTRLSPHHETRRLSHCSHSGYHQVIAHFLATKALLKG